MTSHYDTLGIDRDATPDQIRKAYKKKASSAHPDRHGGDGAAMAAVNAARDCLMDEQRRIHYDATGADLPSTSLEEEAHAALTTMFDEAVEADAVDPVNYVTSKLQNTEAQMVAGVTATKQRIRKLTKARGRVKAKAGQNIVHAIIDRKILDAENQVKLMERGTEVMRAARALANDYEYVPEERPPARQYTATEMSMLQEQARHQINRAFFINPFGGI